jgi:hypothetical protein
VNRVPQPVSPRVPLGHSNLKLLNGLADDNHQDETNSPRPCPKNMTWTKTKIAIAAGVAVFLAGGDGGRKRMQR